MCGREITGDMTWKQIYDLLNITGTPPKEVLHPNYNAAPTSMNPIVTPDGGVMARWWLIPHWYQKPISEMKFTTFNARSETAHEKPMFRDAMKSGHCLVPVQGYYEWKDKQPHVVKVSTNAPAFCFAGLYTHVTLPDFEGYTYTVLTEPSDGPIKHLHHRMPVMVDESSYDDWLRAEMSLNVIKRVDLERLQSYPVKGPITGNDPSLIEEVF